LISSYTLGIYPRSEELIEATRKKTSNMSSLFLRETKDYISLQKKAKLGYVCDPLLQWDDIFRPFAQLKSVKFAALNRIYEMNTFYRRLSFENSITGGGNIVKSNISTTLLPKNRAVKEEKPKKSKLASFVDPKKDPQHYIDRYNKEKKYKAWFDKNYPNLTIEEAVGLKPSTIKEEKPTKPAAKEVKPKKKSS